MTKQEFLNWLDNLSLDAYKEALARTWYTPGTNKKTECLKCGCPYEQKGDFYYVSEETLKYLERASQGNYNITAKVGDMVTECLECGSPLWWSTQPMQRRREITQEQLKRSGLERN